MDKWQNGLLTVGRFVLAAVLCVALVAALLCFALQTACERGVYIAAAETDAVVSALHTEVLEQLESECLFYDLPYDTMKTALPLDTVKTVVTERASAVHTALATGASLPSVTLSAAPFKTAIDSFFDTLPMEERPLDTDASQTIATELSESLSRVLSMGIGDKVLKTAHPLFARAHRLADMRVWLLLGVFMLAAVGMIPVKTTFRRRAYSTVGALFLGSAITAVPTWLFASLDFPAKLAIGDSALRDFVRTVLYTVIDRMTVIVTIAFIVSAVLLTASVVWLVKDKKQKTA